MSRQTAKNEGYILVFSVALLMIVTMVTIAMGRGFFVEEGMASSMREKVRSFTAAQSAMSWAEWNVKTSSVDPQPINCSPNAPSIGLVLCNNPVAINPVNQTQIFAYSTSYALPGVTYSASGGVDTYYAQPLVYIQMMGASGRDSIYRITTAGYGGNQNAVTILQSTYKVTASVFRTDQP